VFVYSQQATISGGHLIDLRNLDLADPAEWAAYHHGCDITDGEIIGYKAVDDKFTAGHEYIPTIYLPGTTVTATDWEPARKCGHGLHFSPTPAKARRYYTYASRFVKIAASLDDVIPLDDKAKARQVRVLCEVDEWMREVNPS